MKKITYLLILLALVFIIGCKPQSFAETKDINANDNTDAPDTSEDKNEVAAEESYIKLVKKAQSYESVEYDLGEDSLTKRLYTVNLKGDNSRIALPDFVHMGNREYYDTVYLNAGNGEANAYCESREKFFCPDKDKSYKIKYGEYVHKTPLQWVKEIQNPTYHGIEVLNFRDTTKLSYKKDNKDVFIWIDNFYGLPIKVLEPSGKSWHFNYIRVNNVKDEQVMHN